MSNHPFTVRICIGITAFTIILAIAVSYFSKVFGITLDSAANLTYISTLFDTSRVHKIDLTIDKDNWNELVENASAKNYYSCDVTIDGETINNAAVRAKGQNSLMSVGDDSERYSLKLEFDHYTDGGNYHGLDKLALNNVIQDNTYLKDYLVYDMMRFMDVDAPLCSYAALYLNGEYFGLYIAAEGIEESFAQRNYGSNTGKIYKPDSNNLAGREPDSQLNGTNDVALQYTDDSFDSYSNIWDGAVLDITDTDKTRLISSLKQLNEGKNLEQAVDIDEVLRYFVVHNFSDNFDSYTGSLMHNYYLRENNGQLSMIAWDYNLAFGGFGGSTSGMVNFPIDTPVSGTTLEQRPMLGQLLANEEYLEKYHDYFNEFITGYFDSGRFDTVYQQAVNLISSYVKSDPTAFCTYEDFITGIDALQQFISLRIESIRGQLDGSIPSTSDGQRENPDSLIDAGDLDISLTGSNNMGRGGREQTQPAFNRFQPNNDTGNENTAPPDKPDSAMQRRPPDDGENNRRMNNMDNMRKTPVSNQAVPLIIICTICLLSGIGFVQWRRKRW